ncbi:MBL fold metallo-hydrolase [Cohnella panacarvi]|uniref:MBL fold metallo-hydrolase n=1 Tax=Cohnella panacarvi TaxID=400776 RepID=UPI0004796C9F|nr:MBL fold metallo-hydrolase [Cohnella panacarvi]
MHSIHTLDIEFEQGGQRQVITPTLLQDGQDTILVDCGYPNFEAYLEAAVNRVNLALSSITKLIVTHHDIDHMGSLAALKRMYPRIEIIAHELEKPYIVGTAKSLRLEQAESGLEAMPEEAKPFAEQFIAFLRTMEPAAVDRTVYSGEKLPWCGGIEIVHTPGHMTGHISLYVPSSKTLIAADAVVLEQSKLDIANPQYTLDMEAALNSVRNLLAFDIDRLICYHGGVLEGDVRGALRKLLEHYSQ